MTPTDALAEFLDLGFPTVGNADRMTHLVHVTVTVSKSGIHFPFEHFMMFDSALWKGSFCSYDMLNITVGKVQIWAMGMIMALHCLAKYNGASTVELPHVSCAHLHRAATAFHLRKEHDEHVEAFWVKPTEDAPELDEEPTSSPEASPLPTPPASEAASDSAVEVEDISEWF
ncbi:hypothetical protein BDV93DRAFT_515260 [Ceratobasidium sp. AG-I]|nr:hypothetical protein BDV93DRAFT_515260 [Ceratobasidium sp. AG-I]